MGRITITLPEELREPLEALAEDGGFNSPDDYLAALIEQRQVERFRQLIEEGLASPVVAEVNEEFWRNFRQEILGAE